MRSPQGASSSSAAATTRSIVVLREHQASTAGDRRRRPRHPHRSIARHPRIVAAEVRADRLAAAQGGRDELLGDQRAGSRPRTRLRCAAVRGCARHAAMTDAACSSPAASRTSPASSHMQLLQRSRVNAGSSFRPPSSSTRSRPPSARASARSACGRPPASRRMPHPPRSRRPRARRTRRPRGASSTRAGSRRARRCGRPRRRRRAPGGVVRPSRSVVTPPIR